MSDVSAVPAHRPVTAATIAAVARADLMARPPTALVLGAPGPTRTGDLRIRESLRSRADPTVSVGTRANTGPLARCAATAPTRRDGFAPRECAQNTHSGTLLRRPPSVPRLEPRHHEGRVELVELQAQPPLPADDLP